MLVIESSRWGVQIDQCVMIWSGLELLYPGGPWDRIYRKKLG